MTISIFTPGDVEAASLLHALCFPDPWPAEGFAALLATGAFGFKAVEDEAIAGVILARGAVDECEILTFAVAPHQRRQGLGSSLLAWLIGSLDNGSTASLFLEVAEGNDAAQGLYRAAGFTPTGRRSGYYSAGSEVQDAIIMRKILIA